MYIKKYEKIKDLIDIVFNALYYLERDLAGEKKLVRNYYTTSTNGGSNILWQVSEKHETVWTVSTGNIVTVKVGQWQYDTYGHYVLTEAGQRWLKEKLVEELI